MKTLYHTIKIICFLLLAGTVSVSAQAFFRVIGGIPHLPAIDPVTLTSPLPGMLVYSKPDKQPMIYNGSTWETLCSSNILIPLLLKIIWK
ncbi:hypothetical protein [Pedobacter sp. NJ-S-72]